VRELKERPHLIGGFLFDLLQQNGRRIFLRRQQPVPGVQALGTQGVEFAARLAKLPIPLGLLLLIALHRLLRFLHAPAMGVVR
jgi:hypothetical protein